jgi:threonine/homoserine/homoserine lactone efflux protein
MRPPSWLPRSFRIVDPPVFAYVLQGFLLGFPAAATPGPLQAFYLAQTMRSGWKRTLPAALAPLLSDGPIILLVLVVLTRTPDSFLRGLRIAGGLFILYLAFNAVKQFRQQEAAQAILPDASHKSLFKAVVTNLLNPNPYIFWGVVSGPILIEAWRQSPAYGMGFLLGFYGTMITGLALLIMIFAAAGRFSLRAARLLSALSALVLFAFGLYQLWTGLAG